MKSHIASGNVAGEKTERARTAVGYVRVSTDMQAVDGLSRDAQTAAIEKYCAANG